jgi:hypothetical protein
MNEPSKSWLNSRDIVLHEPSWSQRLNIFKYDSLYDITGKTNYSDGGQIRVGRD